jgi:hypothetical protein
MADAVIKVAALFEQHSCAFSYNEQDVHKLRRKADLSTEDERCRSLGVRPGQGVIIFGVIGQFDLLCAVFYTDELWIDSVSLDQAFASS